MQEDFRFEEDGMQKCRAKESFRIKSNLRWKEKVIRDASRLVRIFDQSIDWLIDSDGYVD